MLYVKKMKHTPELIVMLTHNDVTVPNAREIFEECKDTKAKFWGFKEEGIPLNEMKELYSYMKKCGKTTFLEVVAYSEEECLNGAEIGAVCGVDYLLGTMYFDSVDQYCTEKGLQYLPFVGKIEGRPSVLYGSEEEIIKEAADIVAKGNVAGFDLLGYRFVGDAARLNKCFVEETTVPVVLAGSVNSYQRLDEVKDADPWAFTIGGAFFENKFDGTFAEQINKVVDYMENCD